MKKIIGIFIVTLLIVTVLPIVSSNIDNYEEQISIEELFYANVNIDFLDKYSSFQDLYISIYLQFQDLYHFCCY